MSSFLERPQIGTDGAAIKYIDDSVDMKGPRGEQLCPRHHAVCKRRRSKSIATPFHEFFCPVPDCTFHAPAGIAPPPVEGARVPAPEGMPATGFDGLPVEYVDVASGETIYEGRPCCPKHPCLLRIMQPQRRAQGAFKGICPVPGCGHSIPVWL